MAGMWKNDDSSNTTRTVVKSHCRTEEAHPGKYIRVCERTEETFKQCIGRPHEMIQSSKEYTEEYVTHQMVKGPFAFDPSQNGSSYFPGLRDDIEAIKRDIFGGINSFFEAAEDIKNDIFDAIRVPRVFDKDSSSSSRNKREFCIEGPIIEEASAKKNSNGEIDLSGLARDV